MRGVVVVHCLAGCLSICQVRVCV